LQKRLLQLLAAKSPAPHLQRIEFPIDEITLLPWLAAQNFKEKIYWYDRQTQTEIAGIGCTDCIHTEDPSDYFNVINHMTKKLSSEYPEMRYFGGFSFNSENGHDPYWQNFGNNAFFLPLFEIIRKGKTYLFAMNFDAQNSDDFSGLISKIEMIEDDIPELTDQMPYLIDHTHFPDKTGWDTMLAQALMEIEKQDFEKIVLARKTKLQFEDKINGFNILHNLKKLNPDSTHFCIQPDYDTLYIGGTPELLYRRQNENIFSVAIAGTRKRSQDGIEDKNLEEELLNSEKDIREHRIVIDNVRDILTGLCSEIVTINPISVLKLARVQHLYTSFEGRLKSNQTDIDIISKLHPTPAVGGFPTDKALAEIARLEPFNRGWYAAPVGWISAHAAHFVVAIRSGLINNRNLYLYSGAGIVAGSDADLEWEEVENKLANFLRAVNVNGEVSKESGYRLSAISHPR
jgi:menaquinone-specific isochorismate synthase